MDLNLTEYELMKKQHKRELVRNEYKLTNKYEMPIIRKQKIDLDKIEFLSYVNTKKWMRIIKIRPFTFLLTIGYLTKFTIKPMMK